MSSFIYCKLPYRFIKKGAARFFFFFFFPASTILKCSDLQKSGFSSPILNMLKSSVGYENLNSTRPSHDKQTLKISWKSAKHIFQEKSSKNALKYGN